MKWYLCAVFGLAVLAVHCLASKVAVRADSRDEVSPLLVRAQLTKWPIPTRTPPERIELNEAGKVVKVWLDGVKLEAGDIERICSFNELIGLSLSYTAISDQELAALAKLPHLQGLRLNYTAIGDDGVASLAKFPQLKSVCLFKIHASPEAIRKLKLERHGLQIGYAPLGK